MARVFSGIQPTGEIHLGNYLGAIRHYVRLQEGNDAVYCVVDLHALTFEQDPAELQAATLGTATVLLAAGLDPDVCTLFLQSHVPAHTELSWLLECTVSYGQLLRMTQFKEKGEGRDTVSAGLLTYPALMAADILLYDTERVPVGEDQRQHLELARDIARRFNARYGETFVVPEAAISTVGARIMDLQAPTMKMSKSRSSPQGKIMVLESPESVARKLKRAVTDTGSEVRYDRAAKPGVANLLDLLSVATGEKPDVLAGRYQQYGPLKADTAAAVIEYLRPLRERHAELAKDPAEVAAVLARGADKAAERANHTLQRARQGLGLLPR